LIRLIPKIELARFWQVDNAFTLSQDQVPQPRTTLRPDHMRAGGPTNPYPTRTLLSFQAR
jgi:hypothetical protein